MTEKKEKQICEICKTICDKCIICGEFYCERCIHNPSHGFEIEKNGFKYD